MHEQQIETWLRWAAYFLPALAAAWGVWVRVRKPVKAFAAGVVALGDIGDMRADIRYIKGELTHNGGKTVKDVVVRSEISGRHREAMLRAHFANNDEGQFETDANGALTWANDTLTRWTGQPEHNLHGKSFYSIIATDQQEQFREQFEQAIADRREFRGRCEIRSQGRPTDTDGSRITHLPTDWRVMVVRDPMHPPTIIGYSGNIRLRQVTVSQPALPAKPAAYMLPDDGQ